MKQYSLTVPLLVGSAFMTSLLILLEKPVKGEFLFICVIGVIVEFIFKEFKEIYGRKNVDKSCVHQEGDTRPVSIFNSDFERYENGKWVRYTYGSGSFWE